MAPLKTTTSPVTPGSQGNRKEVELNVNFGNAKRASHAHNALTQVLAGGAHKIENSQKEDGGQGTEATVRALRGNTDQEKRKGKARSMEDHKTSGFASMFSKITSSKTKTRE